MLLPAPSALAQTAQDDAALPAIVVVFDDTSWPQALARSVVAELEFRLQREGFAVLTKQPSQGPKPAAVLHLGGFKADNPVLTLDLDDGITQRRISESVSLAGEPDEIHSEIIAQSVAELLVDVWAALLIESKARRQRVPRAEQPALAWVLRNLRANVVRKQGLPERETLPSTIPRHSLTAFGRLESYSAGLTLTGLELGYLWWMVERLALSLQGGGLVHVAQSFPGRGDLSGYSLGGGVGLLASMLDRRLRGRLLIAAGVDVLAVSFSSRPTLGDDINVIEPAGVLEVGLQPGWQLTPRVAIEGGLGLRLALQGPVVTDQANNELSGLSGLAIAGRVGVRVSLDGAFW